MVLRPEVFDYGVPPTASAPVKGLAVFGVFSVRGILHLRRQTNAFVSQDNCAGAKPLLERSLAINKNVCGPRPSESS